MRAAVLTYHSNNVLGHDYAQNDHVALASDLATLAALRIPVVPLQRVVDALDAPHTLPERCVALSCDDGSWFDWHDLEHPTLGMQRSFANVLGDAEAARPGVPVHMTSFVIVSPQARAELDRTCLIGRGWWGEEWWQAALDSGRMAIESHSWDHQHDTLAQTATGLPGGTFRNVDTQAAADIEILQASAYLDAALPSRRTRLFAYPYGDVGDYLADEYLPLQRARHGLDAAFGTEPIAVHGRSDRWRLGRYVCGQHWNSAETLEALMRDAFG
ncbi:polysaccharide deacetylase family protein [Chiayiivirga flava]|uniref:Peptidoglycan/xylan/chitin deacetylase (PgdA/CDA1 family) n=1 Tax=Chiayiivirga flava TaxID=659595 RepID=A0A7W8D4K3_9GAMM|nr:polysaccharide deacetylase family protein [Chiayiivirga flava]MBB5207820.1 peptidoglycan/xylan/chitin deacetylase (PgdA/CDA1 family) [Chiayiivirga flava]